MSLNVEVPPESAAFYRRAMRALKKADVPFLLGGAHALTHYTGIARHTKDIDIFVRPRDAGRAREVLSEAGYETELTASHWLAKARKGDNFIDIIFNSENGLCEVDDNWFERADAREVLGVSVALCPLEEMIWTKSSVMERHRYDGADVAHLLRSCAEDVDWDHLLERFGPHWPVLFSHLVLFEYIYPAENKIPPRIMQKLMQRLQEEQENAPPTDRVCRGPFLSPTQYLIDVQQWDYQDARLQPYGPLTADQIDEVTAEVVGEERSS